jgi:hypothetical protein
MIQIELTQVEHGVKIGHLCGEKEPNITEDTLFTVDAEPIGFYIKEVNSTLKNFVEIANNELLSDRVPKSVMRRSSGMRDAEAEVEQYSTIIGSCPPKPHMKRPYPAISSVHQVKTAQTFVKAMLLACRESEKVIREVAPNIYDKQKKIIEEKVPPKFRFGELFTSSISNFNIAAPFHRDAGNLEGCVNVIIAKKKNARGGNTTIPDYDATVDSRDNSMLVYPAWRNIHGVTPIVPLSENGYRNTLVFYPLKAFNNYW